MQLAGAYELPGHYTRFAQQNWSSLSGGQKQILAVLSQVGPKCPGTLQIYDEPFSALDAEAIQTAATFISSQTSGAILIAVPHSTNKESLSL
jgi:energy-coupling factor transporter ATP-binding protein EcfA2